MERSSGTIWRYFSISTHSFVRSKTESTGIDQSDLSKIERGLANPSIGTLSRIADAMDAELMVSIN